MLILVDNNMNSFFHGDLTTLLTYIWFVPNICESFVDAYVDEYVFFINSWKRLSSVGPSLPQNPGAS